MVNTSATGGYLRPQSAAPDADAAFDRFLHDVIVGIVGLPGDLVRPRWQAKPPKLPEPTTNWCAIGVMAARPLSMLGQVTHDPAANGGTGADQLESWETTEVLASFYGPQAWANAGAFFDGLRITQNREAMQAAGVALAAIGARRQASSLSPQQEFVPRVDADLSLNRAIKRDYPVLNLLEASGVVTARMSGSSRNETSSFTI